MDNENNNSSMKDFESEITNSFKKLNEGDIIEVTVIGVSDTEVMVDMGYFTEGIIPIEELSNNPQFSIKADIAVGDKLKAYVIGEDEREGNITLSKKKADDVIAWDVLNEAYVSKKVFHLKISSTTNAGVITYLEGIRAFIPASQITMSYVEDLEPLVGTYIDAVIIDVNSADKKLVLSGKEVEKGRLSRDKADKIASLSKGIVTTGTVDRIEPYGAFVSIGNGLSGLVHISQICGHRIKSPNEVLKLGEEVNVKILDIKDGKISLSIKAVTENEEVIEEVESAPIEYKSGEDTSTSLAGLLAGIKLN